MQTTEAITSELEYLSRVYGEDIDPEMYQCARRMSYRFGRAEKWWYEYLRAGLEPDVKDFEEAWAIWRNHERQ